MNHPNFICYMTRIAGNPDAKMPKCGLPDEVELLKALRDLKFEPSVNSDRKPTEQEVLAMKNAIAYVWMGSRNGEPVVEGDVPPMKRKRGLQLFAFPAHRFEKEFDLAMIQYYNCPLENSDIMRVGNRFVEMLNGEPTSENITPKMKRFIEDGMFDPAPTMTCSVAHYPKHITIRPDTKPDPEKYTVVDGQVVEKPLVKKTIKELEASILEGIN